MGFCRVVVCSVFHYVWMHFAFDHAGMSFAAPIPFSPAVGLGQCLGPLIPSV